ncbi:uncharacterized protein OCT59_018645 [Rhizophagus irregularis]|uniref:uncharacterized protein n=1 Tax=Rhizophagus irregularis TaxID=588596 RepID=UPI00331CDB54|nr:hypothetical protein OCT59_018645 [Rhizophagus irregularis]
MTENKNKNKNDNENEIGDENENERYLQNEELNDNDLNNDQEEDDEYDGEHDEYSESKKDFSDINVEDIEHPAENIDAKWKLEFIFEDNLCNPFNSKVFFSVLQLKRFFWFYSQNSTIKRDFSVPWSKIYLQFCN